MRRLMVFLTLVLFVSPGVVVLGLTPQASADSSPGIMSRTGRAIKDSWITSKTKAKLIS
jgi:hypothetical protein